MPFKLHFWAGVVFSDESANWYARWVDKSASIPIELRNLVYIWSDMQKIQTVDNFFFLAVFVWVFFGDIKKTDHAKLVRTLTGARAFSVGVPHVLRGRRRLFLCNGAPY